MKSTSAAAGCTPQGNICDQPLRATITFYANLHSPGVYVHVPRDRLQQIIFQRLKLKWS